MVGKAYAYDENGNLLSGADAATESSASTPPISS